MPQTAPVQAPTRISSPITEPDPDEGWQLDPGKICPAQKNKETRTLSPFMP